MGRSFRNGTGLIVRKGSKVKKVKRSYTPILEGLNEKDY